MILYSIIFFIPIFIFIITSHYSRYKSTFSLVAPLIVLGLFVGFSDMLGGYDRYIYGEVFDSIADVTTEHGSYTEKGSFLFFPGEFGYTALNILISFYTENRYIFILSITIITYLLLFIDLKRYTENYSFALILFMGLWFFFSFTYLRQVLGATVAWLGIRYVIRRNLLKFLLVCFVAFSIHNSAIVFVPLYFIPIRKFGKGTVVAVMILALLLGLSPIPNALFAAYESNSAFERVNDYNATEGFRVMYLLEAFFFLVIILSNYKNIIQTKTNTVLLNMALGFCAILLFFIRSENGGRIGWYYMIGLISTLTNICVSKRSYAITPYLMIFVCFALYMRIYFSWNTLVYPYKTFFSEGYRESDRIHDKYEYNNDYDTDKFYRATFRWSPNF